MSAPDFELKSLIEMAPKHGHREAQQCFLLSGGRGRAAVEVCGAANPLAQTDLRPQEAQMLNDDEGRYEGCSSIP